MGVNEEGARSFADLRARAEERLPSPSAERFDRELTPHEAKRLVHELRVHQAELEMQNEQLIETKAELEHSRDRYRDLFELAPVGYVSLDEEGRVVEANWLSCTMLGRPRDQLVGLALQRLVDERDADQVHRHLQRVRLSGRYHSCEARIAETMGSGLVVRMETAAIQGAVPDSHCYRTALVDVSERKRAEAVLREREARLRAILETAIDAIVTFDAKGKIEGVNQAAARMFGYASEELLGEPVTALVPDVHQLPHGTHSETLGYRRDGTTLPLDLGVAEQTSGGKLRTVVMRDLTENRRSERQLQQAHKMDAVGRLASGIAHDFNNILMGIIACADVGLNRLSESDPARRYLAEVREAAAGGSSVTGQLMAFSRDHEVDPRTVELDAVIRRTESLLRPLLGEDVAVELSLEAKGGWIRAAPGQLERLLVNLAVNGRDAMAQQGALRIATHAETEHAGAEAGSEPDEVLVLTISDTGHGMDEATRAQAFEPFFTTKGPGEGTGLGLSTVYGIVERLGGSIDLESRPGAGTTFWIHLPRVAPPEPAASEPRPPRGRGQTVLLVEDDPRVRKGVAGYLERGGYRVVEAEDAGQAVALLEERAREGAEVDLVLSDVVLPGPLSGSQLAERLLQRPGHPGVMLMSSCSRPMLADRTPVPQGVPLLEKPFGEGELLEEVGRALRGSSPLTVLIVEDHEVTLAAMRELFEEQGYRVLEARNVTGAFAIAVQGGAEVDLVLTDLGLPGGRGTELATRLRRERPDLPIIYLSGHSPQDDSELAVALGYPRTGYVAKPVELAHLMEMVERLANEDR